MWYILENKKTVKVDNITEYAEKSVGQNRIVEQTKIGDVKISTVFLGLDHNWGDCSPVLFETMIFGGEHDDYQERYHTWEEAEEGHKKACEMVINK